LNQSDPAWLEHLRRIAPAGGKARAKKLTKRRQSEIGRIGGQISGSRRMQNLSAKQRKQIARKAAKARWNKNQSPPPPKPR
jgi:general stress protein YciG